jgi:hypothetical protein
MIDGVGRGMVGCSPSVSQFKCILWLQEAGAIFVIRYPATSAHSLPSARCVTGCRALLPRYTRLIHLRWLFSAVPPASCNEVGVAQHVSFFHHFASMLAKSPKFLYHTHTNRWRSTPVGRIYQIKGSKVDLLSIFSGTRQT